MRKSLLALLVLAPGLAAAADDVYRWVDKEGVVHYGAQAPSKDAKPAELPPLQTYSHHLANKALPVAPADAATKPDAGAPVADARAAVKIKEVRINAPVQDEIFRDPMGVVNVAVGVVPALPPGAGVVFYLDGAAKNAKPSSVTSMTFTSVERGEHQVTAAVVDASGKELRRATPVTFYSKPPAKP